MAKNITDGKQIASLMILRINPKQTDNNNKAHNVGY